MTTLAEIRADVRQHIDELVPAYYGDSVLDLWIYEGARDLARRTKCLQTVRPIDVIANKLNYDLPTDVLQLHRVEFRQESSNIIQLEYRFIDSMDSIWWTSREVAGSYPSWYSVWGTPGVESSQIYIYPVPSASYPAGLRLFYYKLPRKPVDDEDIVEVPAGWEDLISLYAETNALRRAGSPRWQESKAMYDERVTDMERGYPQGADAPNYMTFAGPWNNAWAWADSDGWF